MSKSKKPSAKALRQAADQNKAGLVSYAGWEIEEAIDAFREAAANDPGNPEYHLNLARAYVRSGDYPEAMRCLGDYLSTETDENVASRYERLFSSALDEVETILIEGMRRMKIPTVQIGKAIQMWLEYRITIGRRPLRIPKPELWAAALTHAILKIHLVDGKRAAVAANYDIPERSLQEKYNELVETLDLMPADYRYFTDEHNPLDKLVEAARALEEIYRGFKED